MHWELWLQAHHMTKLSSSNNPPNSFHRQSKQPFREDSAGNSTKVKDVSGVISNTPALNVEAITLPQNASRENQQSPPLALSHPVQLPTPVKVNRLHFYLDGYPTKLKDYLLNGFQHGFLLAYVGPHKPSSCKNLLSAT